jgi:hypothetical protein
MIRIIIIIIMLSTIKLKKKVIKLNRWFMIQINI